MKKPKIFFQLNIEPIYNFIINFMVIFSVSIAVIYYLIFRSNLIFVIFLFILAGGILFLKTRTYFWIVNQEIHWSFMSLTDKKFIEIEEIDSILFLPKHVRVVTKDHHDYAFYMEKEHEKTLYDYFNEKYPEIELDRFTDGLI